MATRAPLRSIAIALGLTGLAGFAAHAAHARGDGILVNTSVDGDADGLCSLREAITAANTNAPLDGCPAGQVGLDLIFLPTGNYPLGRQGPGEDGNATGDLDVTEDLEIRGIVPSPRGADQSVVLGDGSDRIFHVHSGAALRLERVVVQGGSVGGGADPRRGLVADIRGGGILSEGALTLVDSEVFVNEVRGADADSDDAGRGGGPQPAGAARGGGIFASGPLTLERTIVASNRAHGGIGGLTQGGGDASGGGVHAEGPLIVRESTFDQNQARGGAADIESPAPGGRAVGGALVVAGTARIARSTFDGNLAIGAFEPFRGPGPAAAPAIAPAGGNPPPDALGGAIATVDSAMLSLTASTFSDNGLGGGLGGAGGGAGGAARGGAIHHGAGSLDIESCTFDGQLLSGGIGGAGGGAGGEGAGGAIFTTQPEESPVSILHSTFTGNLVLGGLGGAAAIPRRGPAPGGAGGDARGGHLAVEVVPPPRGSPAFALTGSLLDDGELQAGGGGFGDLPGPSGEAIGPGCDALVTSGLGNVESPDDSCGLSGGAGDLVGVDAEDLDLGSVTDNGGPTATALPGEASVALDLALAASCPQLDQRGWFRLDGSCDSGAADTGAFEPVFLDDFESESTNAWTDTVGG